MGEGKPQEPRCGLSAGSQSEGLTTRSEKGRETSY